MRVSLRTQNMSWSLKVKKESIGENGGRREGNPG